MLTFPFGMPIAPVRQVDTGPKRVFVLGVYASAVHARWVAEDGRTLINALAVASEPEIFWRGDGADALIQRIPLPPGAGRLVAASKTLNGRSGVTLDSMFLEPLGITRMQAWLCDLLPGSRCNPQQRAALERSTILAGRLWACPPTTSPRCPAFWLRRRDDRIQTEILLASPEVLVTLGDEPLRWFARLYGAQSALRSYGETPETYGRLHDLEIAGQALKLLPLVIRDKRASSVATRAPGVSCMPSGRLMPLPAC